MAKHHLCNVEDIRLGHSRTFRAHAKNIIVINLAGQFKAYVNYCPHMGGTLRFDGRKFQCTWHGAMFEAATGNATTGPALGGTGLEEVQVLAEDGKIFVVFDEEIKKSPWADDF